MRRALPVVAVLLCACSAERDFDKACELAGKVAADRSLSPMERATVWAKEVDQTTRNSGFRDTFKALAHVAPDDKYRILQQAAEELGVKNWSCPAIKRMWASPDGDIWQLCSRAQREGATVEQLFAEFKPRSDELKAAWPKVLAAPPAERLAVLKGVAESYDASECEALERLLKVDGPPPE